MFFLQLATEILIFIILDISLFLLLKKFNRKDLFLYLCMPLALFTIGFTMRLTSNQDNINLGFFFTEISSIWLYVMFVLALLLGQIKYWKR